MTSPLTGCAAFASIDSVGVARRFGGTSSKITRAGMPSSRSTSMRSPIFSTTPPTVDSTSAVSSVSSPVPGFVRTMRTRLPDGLLHELLGRQQVVVEVLLDDREPGAREADGLRHDLRRHALELEAVAAGGDGQRPHVLDERQVGVVDRERKPLVGPLVLRPRRAERRNRQPNPPQSKRCAASSSPRNFVDRDIMRPRVTGPRRRFCKKTVTLT